MRLSDIPKNGGIFLTAAAVALVAVAVATGGGGMTGATLVLGGVACFVAGILLTVFEGEPAPSSRISGLLPVDSCIGVARLCTDLGVQGNGYTIPPPAGADTPMHFVAAAEFSFPSIKGDFSFLIHEGAPGILVPPAGGALLTDLRERHALHIPHEHSDLFAAIGEVFSDVLEIADRASVEEAGEAYLLTLQGFRLAEGCRRIRGESPRICSIYPCPVCSLAACLLAEGLDAPCTVEHVHAGGKSGDLEVLFSCTATEAPPKA